MGAPDQAKAHRVNIPPFFIEMSIQTDLRGVVLEPEPRPPTRAGFITIFHNAMVYGDPLDALRYGNRPARAKRFGPYRGMILGEIPNFPLDDPMSCRLLFEFYRPDEKVEARRASKAHLRHRGIPMGHFQRYLEKNPLERYLEGKVPLRPLICSECGRRIARKRPGYRLKPVPLCQECNE